MCRLTATTKMKKYIAKNGKGEIKGVLSTQANLLGLIRGDKSIVAWDEVEETVFVVSYIDNKGDLNLYALNQEEYNFFMDPEELQKKEITTLKVSKYL